MRRILVGVPLVLAALLLVGVLVTQAGIPSGHAAGPASSTLLP